jgi:hypothetical protein
MSNEDEKTTFTEFTISGNKENFTIEAEGKTHQGSIRHDGGATLVQLGREEAIEADRNKLSGRQSFTQVEGTIETDAWGRTRTHSVTTHNAPQHISDPRFLLGTLVDRTGAACGDLRQAANNPDNYLVSVGGTQTSLKNAIRLGLVGIDGNGQMRENHRNIAAVMNPNDPSIPGRGQAPPMETIPFNEPTFVALDGVIRNAGLDTSALLAKALGSPGNSAGKELSDLLPGTSPEEAGELIMGVAQVRLESVAKLIEKAGGLEEGEGFEYLDRALNHMSPPTKARLAHGLMTGNRKVINEVIQINVSKDRY